MHPGARNNLDSLCSRYGIDNSHRTLHGALLDAQILADVYLAMTGGQTDLVLEVETGISATSEQSASTQSLSASTYQSPVIYADAKEMQAHQEFIAMLDKKSEHNLWHKF